VSLPLEAIPVPIVCDPESLISRDLAESDAMLAVPEVSGYGTLGPRRGTRLLGHGDRPLSWWCPSDWASPLIASCDTFTRAVPHRFHASDRGKRAASHPVGKCFESFLMVTGRPTVLSLERNALRSSRSSTSAPHENLQEFSARGRFRGPELRWAVLRSPRL